MNPSLAVEDSADRLELACVAGSAGYLAWADVIRRLRLTVSEWIKASVQTGIALDAD